MKRTVITLAGFAALGVVAYISSQLHAQEQQQQQQAQIQQVSAPAPAQPLRTRIAVVNLTGVVSNYEKWKDFENNYKNALKAYDKDFETIKQRGLQVKAELEKAADDASRDRLTTELKNIERTIQDKQDQYKRELVKYRDDVSVQIYREIEDAVRVYARSNDIEMVMQYNDAITPQNLYHPLNVQRKLQTPSCVPMYTAPGMDITGQVAEMLNTRMRAAAPPAVQQK